MQQHSNVLIGASGQGGDSYQIERSLRFNSADSAHLTRTPSSAGNRTTWTWSAWIKRTKIEATQRVFAVNGLANNDNEWCSVFFHNDQLHLGGYTTIFKTTSRVFRDPNAWMHIVVVVDLNNSTSADKIQLYSNGTRLQTNAGSVPSTTGINAATTHYLGVEVTSGFCDMYMADIHFIDGQALTPTDFGELDDNNVWQPKYYSGSYGTNGYHLDFADNSSDSALGTDTSGNGNNWTVNNLKATGGGTNAIEGGEYVKNVTTTISGASYYGDMHNQKLKGFDGSTATAFNISTGGGTSTATWTPTNPVDTSSGFRYEALGSFVPGTYDVYYSINGGAWTQIYNSSNAWITVTVPGNSLTSFATKTVSNNSGWGSGGWHALEVNGTVLVENREEESDSSTDTPTNYGDDTGAGGEVRGNYCTMNPLDKRSVFSMSNGNLKIESASQGSCRGSMAYPSSGKWYYEIVFDSVPGYNHVGIAREDANLDQSPGYDTTREWTYWQNGNKTNNVGYAASFSAGDVIGVAFDADAGSLVFYKNGVSQGVNATGLTSTRYKYFPYLPSYTYTAHVNFGQRPWKQTPPSGYKALCTQNLPDPTIAEGSKHFDTKLWTGNASSKAITGYDFSPDLVWIKARNDWYHHALFDTPRGVNKVLSSSSSSAEATYTQQLNLFNTNGFTLGDNSDGGNYVNVSGKTYVGWAWKAGDGATVTNTDGSLVSEVLANTTAGFSIVTHSGASASATIGHGLNAAPEIYIIKDRVNAYNWVFATTLLANTTDYMYLNTYSTTAANFNVAAPTSSTFVIGQSANSNYVTYLWHSVDGFSKMGTYTGNGSQDGPFVYTGFRPAFIFIKNTDNGNSWCVSDTERDSFNVVYNFLFPDSYMPETADDEYEHDILSNGFKIRGTYNGINKSGSIIIYMAFAEHPFKTSRAR